MLHYNVNFRNSNIVCNLKLNPLGQNGKESPVDGLDVKDFQQVYKNLSKMREVKIPLTTVMKNRTDCETVWTEEKSGV